MENNNFSSESKKNKIIITVFVIVLLIIFSCVCFIVIKDDNKPSGEVDNHNNKQPSNGEVTQDDSAKEEIGSDNNDLNEDGYQEDKEEVEVECNDVAMPATISGNAIEDFDFTFLKIENQKGNKVYSPISIKYALKMVEEGTNGASKNQISNLIGSYNVKKYTNDNNLSFANGLFVKNSYREFIKDSYVDTLLNKYTAEVIYDSFATPDILNNWVSNKTFKLINDIAGDISGEDFVLVNALAIDMEWVNKLQADNEDYNIYYAHRDFSKYIPAFQGNGYRYLEFGDSNQAVKSLEIGAVINRYDIVNELGEENIRSTVKQAYEKWLSDGAPESCIGVDNELDVETYVSNYMKEINVGYNDISSSTDFYFYTDDEVKVFAKDLKEYNGMTLQYVGIMPKNDSLDSYIENIKASNISYLINNLKSIKLENFKEGVITEITGAIPMFSFEYELQLKNDLKKLGITNIFDAKQADLSNLVTENASIDDVAHKTNIEFSNEGIKAAAATTIMGAGAGDCGYDYIYEVPVETIDLTFDNPYLFLIIDKDTKEAWFTGTVYEPIEYSREDGGI